MQLFFKLMIKQQVQSTSDPEEEADPDGVFAFRRKKGCHYVAVSTCFTHKL